MLRWLHQLYSFVTELWQTSELSAVSWGSVKHFKGERGSVTQVVRSPGSWMYLITYGTTSPSFHSIFLESIPASCPSRLSLELRGATSSFIIHPVNQTHSKIPSFLSLRTPHENALFFLRLARVASFVLCSFIKLLIYMTRSSVLPPLNADWGSFTVKQRLFCYVPFQTQRAE